MKLQVLEKEQRNLTDRAANLNEQVNQKSAQIDKTIVKLNGLDTDINVLK